MDCILLTNQLGIFLLTRPKTSHFHFRYFKMYVKSVKTSTEKHHIEILTLKAITNDFRTSLSKGGANSAPLQEL